MDLSHPFIEINQLNKTYGSQCALSNVSLTLSPGCVLGLLGHNGAGKSTLIECILGLRASHEAIKVFGLDPVRDHIDVMSNLSYLSDSNSLPMWMTVKQLVKYVSGMNSHFDKVQAMQYLKDTDIELKAKIGRLSKGMKLQLHLALVIAIDAKVLILDEPTLGLDLIYRERFYSDVLNWYKKGNRSLIIASHEIDEIEHLLTDIVILKQGKVVLSESREDLELRFNALSTSEDIKDKALMLNRIYSKKVLGQWSFLFKDRDIAELSSLGHVAKPSLSEIFLAIQQGD
ncbi:ABC transporter ATP-binding protein YtrB [Photobacterium damselae subsp. piscicida]|uniref:ABC transporter ATP-binding protein YtrB n=1 Tax=Photobacterium damsela subsp. piscicida TaxID=38294 RepID=A0AAD1CEE0_PHODP|nr:ABC transporter ATP-binding protein [Photobacterium damselae]MBE8129386.1 ABC transporter ATP-binding protein [Photobacterium damselae subsp. piscicida]PSV66031.1 ABC transporter ATP-binding protein [Photobacterium damselae]PSW78072.1 ABC transporter ATP-binding protein [Photobacterium damselae]BAX52827.1 ABC transporter ATP-binding protein YtrB [Photobacterium damselae subsp. piscicida]GAW45340.1 ABC transporter ATP-binding protein YtrB [Photobacterium damselae subsp. piscicida]